MAQWEVATCRRSRGAWLPCLGISLILCKPDDTGKHASVLPGSLGSWLAVGGGEREVGRDQQGPTSTHCPLGTDGGDVTCYFDISFLPFSFDFFSFLFSVFLPLSPFCSLDAAKRKAWKLNRVGSLRNIYSSSSTNTEGNARRLPLRQRRPLPLTPPMEMQPEAACTLIVFADSFLWSFHLFVCVFYFTIHVPFSLLKF